jgi:hypothetical protein
MVSISHPVFVGYFPPPQQHVKSSIAIITKIVITTIQVQPDLLQLLRVGALDDTQRVVRLVMIGDPVRHWLRRREANR